MTTGQLPSFFIVGAMRSGTTSLARYLGAHPEVYMAPAKEVHYFDRHYERGADWYREQFPGVDGHVQVGEATQTYLYDEQVPARMAHLVPDAKLIAILRDPVERAYSHYWHERSRGREPLGFPAALAAEPERIAAGGQERFHYSYVDRGRYLPQLQRLCEHYSRESLLVLLFEHLRDRPTEAFADVCRFLGIRDDLVPENVGTPINRHVQFRSRWLRASTLRLPPAVRRLVGRVNSRTAEYPPMDAATRRWLVEQFREDNAALAHWLGIELAAWSR